MLVSGKINLGDYSYYFLDGIGWKILEGILYLR